MSAFPLPIPVLGRGSTVTIAEARECGHSGHPGGRGGNRGHDFAEVRCFSVRSPRQPWERTILEVMLQPWAVVARTFQV